MDIEYVLVGILTGLIRRSRFDFDVLVFPRSQKVIVRPKSPINLNYMSVHHSLVIDTETRKYSSIILFCPKVTGRQLHKGNCTQLEMKQRKELRGESRRDCNIQQCHIVETLVFLTFNPELLSLRSTCP